MKHLRAIYASAYAASLSILVTVVLTMATELSAGFKTWLASFTGHHWVSKSWASILVFVLFYIVFYSFKKDPASIKVARSLVVLEWALILGFVIILGFFGYEFWK